MFGNISFTVQCEMIACILIQCRYDGCYHIGFILQTFAYFLYLCRVKNNNKIEIYYLFLLFCENQLSLGKVSWPLLLPSLCLEVNSYVYWHPSWPWENKPSQIMGKKETVDRKRLRNREERLIVKCQQWGWHFCLVVKFCTR